MYFEIRNFFLTVIKKFPSLNLKKEEEDAIFEIMISFSLVLKKNLL